MDDDLDRVRGGAKEPVRLDHLQALVHQRGRIDRDLPAHLPGGMPGASSGARQRGASNGETGRRGCSRRRTWSSDRPCRLMNRVVLAVDGQNRHAAAPLASTISAPAITSTSLFASAKVLPGIDRRKRRFRAVPRAQSTDRRAGVARQTAGPGRRATAAAGASRRSAPRAHQSRPTIAGRYFSTCSASSAAFRRPTTP